MSQHSSSTHRSDASIAGSKPTELSGEALLAVLSQLSSVAEADLRPGHNRELFEALRAVRGAVDAAQANRPSAEAVPVFEIGTGALAKGPENETRRLALVVTPSGYEAAVRVPLADVRLHDGKFHVLERLVETRPLAPEDFSTCAIRSEDELLTRLKAAVKEPPSFLNSLAPGHVSRSLGLGPSEGFQLQLGERSVRIDFCFAHLDELDGKGMFSHAGKCARALFEIVARHLKEVGAKKCEVPNLGRWEVINTMYDELFTNISGHNIFGVRCSQLVDDKSFKEHRGSKTVAQLSGAIEMEITDDALIIRAFQPNAFRFGTAVTEAEALKEWLTPGEHDMVTPSGLGRFIISGLLSKYSIDAGTHTMTLTVPRSTMFKADTQASEAA